MASSKTLNRNRKVPAEDTAAFGAIAERFRRAGALDRAVGLCREGLQKFPDHISARATLGWALLDLGKFDEARAELELVLRRAPDNLAAIRGLAELHDRFEHTLNLPMDGPGQWPPPPESIEAFADLVAAETSPPDDMVATFAAAGGADMETFGQQAETEMPPAALGVPIWTPVTPASPADYSSTGSGMSSLREIEPGPSAVSQFAKTANDAVVRAIDEALDRGARAHAGQPAPDASPAVTSAARDEDADVTDADIQALIAEAESLDAATVPNLTLEAETVGSLALEATDDSDPLAAIAEVTGMDPAWAVSAGPELAEVPAPVALAPAYSSVTEPIAVEVDLCAIAEAPSADIQDAVAEVQQLMAVEMSPALVPLVPLVEEALTPAAPPSIDSVENEPVEPVEVDAFVLTAPEALDFAPCGPDETEMALEAEAFAMDSDIAPLLPFTEAAAEATIEEFPIEESALAEPASAEPASAKFAFAELAFAETTLADPVLGELALEEPASAALALAEPALAEPTLADPVLEELALEEPASVELAFAEPVFAEPAVAELVPEESAFAKPAVEEPASAALALPEPVLEDAPVEAAIVELAAAETAEVVASPAAPECMPIETSGRGSPLPQLERLLARVQTRRAQLMAESVA